MPSGRHYTYTDAQWFAPRLAAEVGTEVSGLVGTVDGTRAIPRGPVPWHPDVRFVR